MNKNFGMGKVPLTKSGYIGALRNWRRYVLNLQIEGMNPFDFPVNAELLTYWICSTVNMTGSTSCIKRYRASLRWVAECCNESTEFTKDSFLSQNMTTLKKLYDTAPDPRLPFTIQQIINYTKLMGVSKYTMNFVDIKKLYKVMIVQLYFVLGTRPNELLRPAVCGLSNGVDLKDLEWITSDNKYISKFDQRVTITILFFKNQKYRSVPKYVYLGNSECANYGSCNSKCAYLNPFFLLATYLKRRKLCYKEKIDEYNTLKLKIETNSFSKKKLTKFRKELEKLKQYSSNLSLKPNSPLFVWPKTGKVTVTTDLNKIVNEMVLLLHPQDSDYYKPYSLRIGCSTRLCKIKMSFAQILKYIGWATTNLPHVAMRYMRFSPQELAQVARQLVHGADKQALIIDELPLFDPWNTSDDTLTNYMIKQNKHFDKK